MPGVEPWLRMVRRTLVPAKFHAPAVALPYSDTTQENPQTPRAQMCCVVIKEQFAEAVDDVNYLKIFIVGERGNRTTTNLHALA